MGYSVQQWSEFIDSLHDMGHDRRHLIPGADLIDWLSLIQYDYDEIDRFYVDAETIGGG